MPNGLHHLIDMHVPMTHTTANQQIISFLTMHKLNKVYSDMKCERFKFTIV